MIVQPNPNSIIKLYAGVPLDPTYSDTLYFDYVSDQIAYFDGLTPVRTFTANTYQRVNLGQFRAECAADDIYNVNYMAFQNTAFGNKWFYAFVTSVEYVNNGVALVTFEIDVMQTYFFDVTLEQCYVEREHTISDELFSNLVPEPNIVPLSDYIFEGYHVLDPGTADQGVSAYEPDIVVMYVDVDGTTVDGGVFNRTYSGASALAFTSDALGVAAVNQLIAGYIQKPEAIINIYMCPHWISRGTSSGRSLTPGSFFEPGAVTVLPSEIAARFYQQIGSYAPKNNKLFTYPYSYLHLDSGSEARIFRFEFFKDPQSFDFWMYGSNFSPIQLSISPRNYKGVTAVHGLPVERLTLSEYPFCSWNYDTYRAWAAQNTVPMIIDASIGFGSSIVSGDVGGVVQQAGNIAKSIYKAAISSDTIRGNVNNGNALYSDGELNFKIARAHINESYLAIVDEFFTMYGYAVNRVKVPNRDVRPHWTYTKTNGCKLKGNCPGSVQQQICGIYDRGLTFWKNPSEVGQYNLNNKPA